MAIRKPTNRQLAALNFCCEMLDIKFIGNKDNSNEVSLFLSEYLDEAKSLYDELKCEYESYINDLMD